MKEFIKSILFKIILTSIEKRIITLDLKEKINPNMDEKYKQDLVKYKEEYKKIIYIQRIVKLENTNIEDLCKNVSWDIILNCLNKEIDNIKHKIAFCGDYEDLKHNIDKFEEELSVYKATYMKVLELKEYIKS